MVDLVSLKEFKRQKESGLPTNVVLDDFILLAWQIFYGEEDKQEFTILVKTAQHRKVTLYDHELHIEFHRALEHDLRQFTSLCDKHDVTMYITISRCSTSPEIVIKNVI